jgi:hypothetical protein
MRIGRLWILPVLLFFSGCGTSKWTDTSRTATEQLLISDSMDRAVSQLDFRALAGESVYLDSQPLKKTTDSEYLVSLLRQHMLANGCLLRDKREEAEYVVEARAGAVGTDRQEVMFGVPSVNIPSVVPVSGIPSQIPEMPLVKKTDARAVTKIAVFAYNRETGRPVWQSGTIPTESTAKDVWVLGAGPFQTGTIYGGTRLAGSELDIPLIDLDEKKETEDVAVADEAYFLEPGEQELLAGAENESAPDDKASKPNAGGQEADSPASGVVPASHAGDTQRKPAAQPTTDPAEAKPPSGEPAASQEPAPSQDAAATGPRLENPSVSPEPPRPLPPPSAGDEAAAIKDQPSP